MPSAETGTRTPLAERYRVLLDIGRTLTGTLSPEELYRSIYRETARVLEAGGFYISLYDKEADIATVVFYADRGEESRCDITYKGSDSGVIRAGKSTTVEDRLNAESVMLLGEEETDITRSAISAPLIYEGVVRGALSAQSYRPNAYGSEDLELLEGIAYLAAVAIENARHVAEMKRRSNEAEKLEEIGRALTSSLDFEEVLSRVSAAAMDLLDADGAGVWTFDRTVATVTSSVGRNQVPLGSSWDMDGPIYETLIKEGQPFAIDDLAASPLIPEHMREFLKGGSGLAIPLVIGERVAGALAVGSRETRGFSDYDTALLTRLAGQASIALDNAELHANIQALSLTDVLTGLPNRRHLQLHLEREVAAARRGRRLALVLFDLDDFKHYNDTLGHLVGDQILQAFGRVLADENRAMNLVARYGGDEFVSVLSESDEDGAKGYLDRVEARIKSDRVLAPHGVTVSSGIAHFETNQMVGVEELIQSADRHMYEHKERPRRR